MHRGIVSYVDYAVPLTELFFDFNYNFNSNSYNILNYHQIIICDTFLALQCPITL